MKRRFRAVVMLMGLLLVVGWSVSGWASASDLPWRLSAKINVSPLTSASPTVALETHLEGPVGSFHIRLARDPAQSRAYEITIGETLRRNPWTIGTELHWEIGQIPSISFTLGARSSWGQASLKLQAPSRPIHWELSGYLRQSELQLNIRSLKGIGADVLLDGGSFRWSPDSLPLSIGGSLNREQSPPLTIDADAFLDDDLSATASLRWHNDVGAWRWADTLWSLRHAPLAASIDVDRGGWAWASLEARTELTESLEGVAGLTIDPQGPIESELGVIWTRNFTNTLEGTWSVSRNDWAFLPRINWTTDALSATINGSAAIQSSGLNSLLLNTEGALGDLSFDSLINYTGTLWILDLSGRAEWAPWTLRAQGSWLSLIGWDESGLSVGRDWALPSPR